MVLVVGARHALRHKAVGLIGVQATRGLPNNLISLANASPY